MTDAILEQGRAPPEQRGRRGLTAGSSSMCLPVPGMSLQLGTWGDQLLLGLSSLICKMGLPILSVLSILSDSAGKESACNVGDLGSIPGLGRSPGEGKSCPFQCSGLDNSMDYSPWGHKESDRTEQLSLSSCPWGFALTMKCSRMLSPGLWFCCCPHCCFVL